MSGGQLSVHPQKEACASREESGKLAPRSAEPVSPAAPSGALKNPCLLGPARWAPRCAWALAFQMGVSGMQKLLLSV